MTESEEPTKSEISKSDDSQIQSEGVEDEEDGIELVEEEEIPESEREICTEPAEILITKNTPSFACLAQLILSRSSLLKHPLYHFPPLEDPGIDLAFNLAAPEEQIDYVGVDKYRSLCKDFNIAVLSRVEKDLQTPSLNLRYYCLSHKQVKAISKALRNNIYVRELNLEENFMDAKTTRYLCDMLRENDTLQVLNMKECRIGPEGAKEISDGILTTQTLRELDLSCNSLGGEGIKNLKDALKDNCTIKKLNLSKNNLGDDSIPYLCGILADNFVLENIDLSWNRINSPLAWKQLVNEGLILNKDLVSLNLAWNAISSPLVMRSLMKYTKETETLEELDLSNNMLSGVLINMIKGLIMKNTSLLRLNIGFNKLTPQDAQMLIELLLLPANKRPKLEELNMDNVYVKKDFLSFMARAAKLNKTVKIGGVLGNWTIKGPDIPKLLFERCRMLAKKPKKKKLKKDFSHFIFALPDKPMGQSAFTDLVKTFKMKMVDKDLIDQLMNTFKFKKKGVDPVAMRESYLKLYPDAQPAPKKVKKKGKGKKKKKKGQAIPGDEEEAGDQGEEWEEEVFWSEEVGDQGEDEEVEYEFDEEDEEEVEEEDEEDEGEGKAELSEQKSEVAHGESVTDVVAQLADEKEVNIDEEFEQFDDIDEEKSVELALFTNLEPITEESEML